MRTNAAYKKDSATDAFLVYRHSTTKVQAEGVDEDFGTHRLQSRQSSKGAEQFFCFGKSALPEPQVRQMGGGLHPVVKRLRGLRR